MLAAAGAEVEDLVGVVALEAIGAERGQLADLLKGQNLAQLNGAGPRRHIIRFW